MNLKKISSYTLIFMISLMINAFSNAQEANILEDTIYSGVAINPKAMRPFEVKKFYNILNRKIAYARLKYIIKIKDTVNLSSIVSDSMIIHLVSGFSWKLTSKVPKKPPFFFGRLILKRMNVKDKRRFEYLKFYSLCEQKPDLVYLSIDRIEVYESNEKKKYKYIMTLDANNDVIIQERISLK